MPTLAPRPPPPEPEPVRPKVPAAGLGFAKARPASFAGACAAVEGAARAGLASLGAGSGGVMVGGGPGSLIAAARASFFRCGVGGRAVLPGGSAWKASVCGLAGVQPSANESTLTQPRTLRVNERRVERDAITTIMRLVTPRPPKSSRASSGFLRFANPGAHSPNSRATEGSDPRPRRVSRVFSLCGDAAAAVLAATANRADGRLRGADPADTAHVVRALHADREG